MRLSGQFQASLLYFMKSFLAHKKHSQAKMKQQNKIKLTLNNKGNIFYVRKNLKVVSFAFWCFFCAQNLFVKK